MDLTEKIMEHQKREYLLLTRVAQREREMEKLRQRANESVNAFEETQADSLQNAKVDPSVNIEIATLQQRLRDKDLDIERLKEESQSATFHPNSIMGQKLIKKCTSLLEENSELGKQLGEERVQSLKIQIGFERKKGEQLRERLAMFNRRAEAVDTENERLQTKIAELGSQLKNTKAEAERLNKEIEDVKSGKKRSKKEGEDEPSAKKSRKEKQEKV